jgi:hypothetical protein
MTEKNIPSNIRSYLQKRILVKDVGRPGFQTDSAAVSTKQAYAAMSMN